MKLLIAVGLVIGLTGCSNVYHIKTGHYTEQDGVTYERQYWVIQTDPECTGSCLNPGVSEGAYDYKYHKDSKTGEFTLEYAR